MGNSSTAQGGIPQLENAFQQLHEQQQNPPRIDTKIKTDKSSSGCFSGGHFSFRNLLPRLPHTRFSWILLLTVVLQAMVVVSIQIGIVVLLSRNNKNQNDTLSFGFQTYALIFVIAQVATVAYFWNSIVTSNWIQLYAFNIFNFCSTVYSIFQLYQLSNQSDMTVQALVIADFVILCIFDIVIMFISFNVKREFGWQIYRSLGADPNVKKILLRHLVLLTFLMIDVFFWLAHCLQYLVLVLEVSDVEFPATIVILILSIAAVLVAGYSLRHENKKLIIAFLIAQFFGAAYFIYKIVRFQVDNKPKLQNTKKFLTFFASLSLVSLLATMVFTMLCYLDFGKGFAERRKQKQTKVTPSIDNSNASSV